MLVCVLVGYFALQPFMNALRVAAQEAGTDLAHSPYAKRASACCMACRALFYLIESLLGVALVWTPAGAGVVVAGRSWPTG